jgi:phosphatidylglycerol---prolipoprotein diacylglyceryl transferase
VASALSVITIGIDPTIEIGPLTLAWHGLTIAVGILLGGLVAAGEARCRGLDGAPLQTIGAILVVAAMVGSRAYYLAEHGQLLDASEWLGTRGFSFYGGMVAAALGRPHC